MIGDDLEFGAIDDLLARLGKKRQTIEERTQWDEPDVSMVPVNPDGADAVRVITELQEENARLLERVGPIDPGGSDRIDELESAVNLLRHQTEAAEARVAILADALANIRDGLRSDGCVWEVVEGGGRARGRTLADYVRDTLDTSPAGRSENADR